MPKIAKPIPPATRTSHHHRPPPPTGAGSVPDRPGGNPPPAWRRRLLPAAAVGATIGGVVVSAARPAWLTEPLQTAVLEAGAAGPVVYVALCAVTTALHLNGPLVVLSPLFWPFPVAAALSFVGGLIGCVGTAALLARAGAAPMRHRDRWPAWLEPISQRVARRPLLAGMAVRLVLDSGVAVEAFYLLTGYSRRHYLLVTTLGVAARVAQALIGVAALAALLAVSPWLGLAFVAAPAALLGAGIALHRRRTAA